MVNSLNNPVTITQYKWAGSLGPFKIKSQCEECDLTTHSLDNLVKKEFKGENIIFETKPWLDNAFYCLKRGAWHAPIIMINGRLFFQYSHRKPAYDRGKLIETVSKLLD